MSIHRPFSGYQLGKFLQFFFITFCLSKNSIIFEYQHLCEFQSKQYITVPGAQTTGKNVFPACVRGKLIRSCTLSRKAFDFNSRILTDLQNNLCTSSYNLFKNTFNTCSMADHCIAASVGDHHSNDV